MASTTWPPKEGLTTPTVSRKQATFYTNASIRINAPASAVFNAVLEVSKYPEWNNFVPQARIVVQPQGEHGDFDRLKLGSIIEFFVVMNSAKPDSRNQTDLIVTDMSTPDQPSSYLSAEDLKDPSFTADLSKVYRVAWKQHGGWGSKGLQTERFHEIIILGENECELRTWECYGGILARTVKWTYKSTLDEKFDLWNKDLKRYVEGKIAAGTA